MKVIAIDDEISSLQIFLKEIVFIENLECRFFKDDARQILDYVKHNDVSAAFLDVNMPGINGLDLAKKLVEISKGIQIVFVTGVNVVEKDLPASLQSNVLGFIYKPYSFNDVKRYVDLIGNNCSYMEAKMFNSFDCFIEGKAIRFSSAKSKELLALLLAYNGKTLEMSDAISQLWPDAPLENAKRLYRDAVWRLRKTLAEYNVSCVDFSRAQLSLNKSKVVCDYWDYLKNGEGNYAGVFCKSYDWAIDFQNELDLIAERKRSAH